MKSIKTFGLGLLATAALGAALFASAPAHADEPWIVLAVSQSSGWEAIHAGNPYTAAVQSAVNFCNRKGYVTDCLVVAQGRGGCVAAATAGRRYGIWGAWAPTRDAAASAALAQAGPGSRLAADCVGDPGLQGR
jgi:hypothetical protein